MSKQFLVFQHMSWEGPGRHLVEAANRENVSMDIVEVWREPIPDVGRYDGLIVLGGGPNVDQEKEYPFLRDEKRAIHGAIENDKAYLGFCLGHQLLAEALGGRVGPNYCRSIGFIEGHLTKEGRNHPAFADIPKSFPLFKWHSQAVLPPLPKGIEVLVTSAACQVEGISVENRPYLMGLQFDNQSATVVDARQWLQADEAWLSQPPGVDPAAILRDAADKEAPVGRQFEILFRNFVQLIG
jgi:GMP synthase (glutamine-hydrolysing)